MFPLLVEGVVEGGNHPEHHAGTEENAGAHFGPESLARALALGLDPEASLNANDAYSVFAALGDLVVTGPTRTNVNDFRALLIV